MGCDGPGGIQHVGADHHRASVANPARAVRAAVDGPGTRPCSGVLLRDPAVRGGAADGRRERAAVHGRGVRMKKPPKPVRHHLPPVVHGGQFVPRRSHAKPPNPVRANFGGGQLVQRPRKPVHKKPRKWSPGSDVACCSAQALGTLLGWDAAQVLALYWRTASHPDAGATILDTIRAAQLMGSGSLPDASIAASLSTVPQLSPPGKALSLILGVTLPEPHAIAVTPDGGWWSWGQPFDPAALPDLPIAQAGAVTWCLR